MWKYAAYKLKKSDGVEVFATSFTDKLTLDQANIRFLLADLQSTKVAGKSDHASELVMEQEGQQFVVKRDYNSQQADIQPANENLANFRNPYIVTDPGLNPKFDDQLQAMLSQIKNPQADLDLAPLEAEIVAKGGEVAQNYMQTQIEIDELEDKIARQKSDESGATTIAELEAKLAEITEQINSVKSLVDRKQSIDNALAKYGPMLQADLEGQGVKLRQQLNEIRLQELRDIHKPQGLIAQSKKFDVQTRDGWQASYLVILGIIALVFGVLVYLINQNTGVLVLSVLLGMFEMMMFGAINYIPAKVDAAGALLSLHSESSSSSSENLSSAQSLPAPKTQDSMVAKLEKFFVDKAWISALRNEVQNISNVITTKLEGKQLADLQTAYENLQHNIGLLKEEMEKYRERMLTPEQYIQLRRDLDKLKITKVKQERDLQKLSNSSEIFEALVKLEDSRFSKQTTVIDLDANLKSAMGIVGAVMRDGELITLKVDDTEGDLDDLAPEAKFGLFLSLRATMWKLDPQVPFICVIPSNLSANFVQWLDTKLAEIATAGQVVRVEALAQNIS